MTEGPFTITWEAFPYQEHGTDVTWTRFEQTFETELSAVRHWRSLVRYANTRPLTITPEPDWSAYTSDGRTPTRK